MTDENSFETKEPKNNLDILDNRDVCYAGYILNLLAPFNGLTGIIALVLILLKKSDADEFIDSHYTYQLRTIIIGTIGVLISCLLMLVLIGFLTFFIVLLWWFVRSAIGLKHLIDNKPIPNPNSWLV